jgi:threonylcarbamoyladenosine tRNA methylthiotransferase CDKAL1
MTMKKKVWIETYGCSANKADSEIIMGQLIQSGYEIANDEKESSINMIVTCSVKDATEHKMLNRIEAMSKSAKPIVVAGCLPKANRERIETFFPSASLLGPHSLETTTDVVSSAISGKKKVSLEDSSSNKIDIPRVRFNPVISIVQIATGCISECTFCQTKLSKGWLRSYRIGDIIRQIKHDVAEGCKEIWLTSTDNGCYGRDIKCNLVDLLKACCKIEGIFKIRVGMMNPMHLSNILQDLVEVYRDNDQIFKFIHLPVQSGSDSILRKMKRGHAVATYRDIVRVFRQEVPGITIATDIIVGFPSETDEDFDKTLALIKESQPDVVHSSKYSARAKTKAALLKQINSAKIKERTEKLHLLIKEIGRIRNSLWKGWRGEIIIDEITSTGLQGRNYAYKPVFMPFSGFGSLNEEPCQPSQLLGTRVQTLIQGYSCYSLQGVKIC